MFNIDVVVKAWDKLSAPMKRMQVSVQEFQNTQRLSNEQWGRTRTAQGNLLPIWNTFPNKYRMMTKGVRGWNMQALGMMFFGMALTRMFSGMLKPVLEVFGVMDLWSATMQLVMLPVMEALYPILLKLMEWLMAAPPWLKVLIGSFVVVGAVMGALLMVLGMLLLGMAALGVSLLPLIAIFLVIVAVVFAVIMIWRNWGKIMDWFKDKFARIVDWIDKKTGGMATKVIDKIKSIIQGIKNFFTGWKIVWRLIFNWLHNKIKEKVDGYIKTFRTFKDGVMGIARKFYDVGKTIVTRIVDGLNAVKNKIKDTLWNLLPEWARNAISTGGVIYEALKNFTGVGDFIITKRGQVLRTDPRDTIMGFKGPAPAGMGAGSVNINATYNISGVSSEVDLERVLREHDDKLKRDIKSEMRR